MSLISCARVAIKGAGYGLLSGGYSSYLLFIKVSKLSISLDPFRKTRILPGIEFLS